jgi:aminomethyltransferase
MVYGSLLLHLWPVALMPYSNISAVALTEFASWTGTPPFPRTGIRMRSGLKRTAFYPTISRFAREWKLHNGYLKPDKITDPLEEYWAMRTAAGLWDVTGEEVIEISGPEALAVMDELVPRDLSRLADGKCLYCVMCYDYGGIVEDAVLVRFSANRLWWVGGPGSSEQAIYARAIGRNVTVTSHLDALHVASLQGPMSRDILQSVTAADLAPVPYYGLIETTVCGVPATITRTGYTAELGYDIYVDVVRGADMFADLWDASRPKGAKLAGSRALNMRRIEAAILNFGHDFDWQHNPYDVGLGWMVSGRKPFFAGKTALDRLPEAERRPRLVGLRLEGDGLGETGDEVRIEGRRAGVITSTIHGPSLGFGVGMAMLDRCGVAVGTELTVLRADRQLKAQIVPMPFLDPERKLAKA